MHAFVYSNLREKESNKARYVLEESFRKKWSNLVLLFSQLVRQSQNNQQRILLVSVSFLLYELAYDLRNMCRRLLSACQISSLGMWAELGPLLSPPSSFCLFWWELASKFPHNWQELTVIADCLVKPYTFPSMPLWNASLLRRNTEVSTLWKKAAFYEKQRVREAE